MFCTGYERYKDEQDIGWLLMSSVEHPEMSEGKLHSA